MKDQFLATFNFALTAQLYRDVLSCVGGEISRGLDRVVYGNHRGAFAGRRLADVAGFQFPDRSFEDKYRVGSRRAFAGCGALHCRASRIIWQVKLITSGRFHGNGSAILRVSATTSARAR